MYFSGKGKVYLAERQANGDPGVFRFVGNVQELNVQMSSDTSEKRERQTGRNLVASRITTTEDAAVNMTMDEFTADNLALALHGAKATIASGSVTAEALPNPVAQGDFVRTAQQNISNVVIEDAAGSPATLVEGTDYQINSAEHGSIEFIGDLSGYTMPLNIDYDFDGAVNVTMFSNQAPKRWLRLEGINSADADKPVLIELYEVMFDPVSDLGMITEEHGELALTGAALYDDTKEGDTELGQFGRYMDLSQTGA